MIDLTYWRRRLAAQTHSASPHVGLTVAQFAEILDEVEAARKASKTSEFREAIADAAISWVERVPLGAMSKVRVITQYRSADDMLRAAVASALEGQ